MKTKKLNSKLLLNKKTVSNLGNLEMKALNGGVYTGYTCQDDGCDTVISCRNTECYICESIQGCPDPAEITQDCPTYYGCLSNVTECWSDPWGPACN